MACEGWWRREIAPVAEERRGARRRVITRRERPYRHEKRRDGRDDRRAGALLGFRRRQECLHRLHLLRPRDRPEIPANDVEACQCRQPSLGPLRLCEVELAHQPRIAGIALPLARMPGQLLRICHGGLKVDADPVDLLVHFLADLPRRLLHAAAPAPGLAPPGPALRANADPLVPYLGRTAEQKTQWETARQSCDEGIKPLREHIDATHQQLEQLMDTKSTDAAAIGNLMIDIRNTHDQI